MVAKVYEEMKDKEVGIKDTDINANIGDRDAKNDVNADALLKLKDLKALYRYTRQAIFVGYDRKARICYCRSLGA